MSYRRAFSLSLNQPQIAWLALLFMSTSHLWDHLNWCFSWVTVSAKEDYTSFASFTLLLAYVGHPLFSLDFDPWVWAISILSIVSFSDLEMFHMPCWFLWLLSDCWQKVTFSGPLSCSLSSYTSITQWEALPLIAVYSFIENVEDGFQMQTLGTCREGGQLGKCKTLLTSSCIIFLSNVKTNGDICVPWPTSP